MAGRAAEMAALQAGLREKTDEVLMERVQKLYPEMVSAVAEYIKTNNGDCAREFNMRNWMGTQSTDLVGSGRGFERQLARMATLAESDGFVTRGDWVTWLWTR